MANNKEKTILGLVERVARIRVNQNKSGKALCFGFLHQPKRPAKSVK